MKVLSGLKKEELPLAPLKNRPRDLEVIYPPKRWAIIGAYMVHMAWHDSNHPIITHKGMGGLDSPGGWVVVPLMTTRCLATLKKIYVAQL